ncbi:C1 family peptidase [candidate division KSB1 bacterium]
MKNLLAVLLIIFCIACCDNGISYNRIGEDAEIPASLDLRNSGIITPVKDQGNFGSCGIFAGVSVFEALIKKETGKTVDLSEQHVINYSPDWRSSGISSLDVLKFMKENGIVLEDALPYEAAKTDSSPLEDFDYKLTDCISVVVDKMPLQEKIISLKKAILEYGPVATTMNLFDSLQRYTGGVYMVGGSDREIGGHWVVVVGWSDDNNIKNGGCWICRNSAGPEWGEEGYFRIAYGESGIDDYYFCYGIYKIK